MSPPTLQRSLSNHIQHSPKWAAHHVTKGKHEHPEHDASSYGECVVMFAFLLTLGVGVAAIMLGLDTQGTWGAGMKKCNNNWSSKKCECDRGFPTNMIWWGGAVIFSVMWKFFVRVGILKPAAEALDLDTIKKWNSYTQCVDIIVFFYWIITVVQMFRSEPDCGGTIYMFSFIYFIVSMAITGCYCICFCCYLLTVGPPDDAQTVQLSVVTR